jgi:hypothetical protein
MDKVIGVIVVCFSCVCLVAAAEAPTQSNLFVALKDNLAYIPIAFAATLLLVQGKLTTINKI